MFSRDDFRFVLLPWEHRGANFNARPDFVARARVGGFEQLFLLKVRSNRVFFRLAEDETRVWGTTCEIEGEPVSFWNAEIEGERFGRLFWRETHLNATWDITLLAALVCGDGSALLCEWCSNVWWKAQFSPEMEKFARTRQHLNLWQAAWRPSLRQLMARNRKAVCDREMPAAEREATRKRQVCGSAEELNRLLGLFCIVHAAALARAFYRTKNIRFALYSAWPGQELPLQLTSDRNLPHFPLLDVFVEHNQTWGVEWQTWTGKTGGKKRGDWRLLAGGRVLEFLPIEPTAHQQLEARLELRDWLRDKAPAEQIESWLGSPL